MLSGLRDARAFYERLLLAMNATNRFHVPHGIHDPGMRESLYDTH